MKKLILLLALLIVGCTERIPDENRSAIITEVRTHYESGTMTRVSFKDELGKSHHIELYSASTIFQIGDTIKIVHCPREE